MTGILDGKVVAITGAGRVIGRKTALLRADFAHADDVSAPVFPCDPI